MKRGRTEEIQFGQPRVQPPTGQQRIITTTQPHNVASSTGTTIQYQIPPNVIKTSTPPETVNSVTNLSSQQQQQATQLVVPSQQATSVQYTTSYNTTLGANLVKAQQTTNPQQQQIHVVNASNQVRGPTHKNAVVNATAAVATNAATPNNNISVSGGPPGTTGVVTTGGVQQVITTSMSPGVLPGSGSAAQGPPPPAPQGQAQLQRLKVEDALSYLDQVKYRFGNQPQVYNDFLDIMKEFKSQSIDTPGVIQRVSNLFRGHPELIVGFNTFLPPGYKIEVQANDQGCYLFQVSVSVQPTASSGASVAPQPSPHKYNTIFQGGGQIVQSTGSGGAGVAAGGSNVVTASAGGGNAGGGTTTGAVNLMAYGGGGHAATAAAAPGASVPVHGGTSLQQPTTGGSVGGNASPATAQNAQSLTTTTATVGGGGAGGGGTGPQVAQNFSSRGGDHHRERTISTGSAASNASLPAGVTASSTPATTIVTAVDASSAATVVTGQQQLPSQATPSSIHRILTQQIISQQHATGAAAAIGGMVPTGIVSAPTQVQHHQQTTMQQVQPPPEAQTATVTTTVVPTPTATANQPVEFNHAITYVNKIKNRFHTQPEKYKRFLEILHTYQKEQKTYKEGAQSGCLSNAKQLTEAEVYTQVAQLFDNQEDLLREFGQFLPDATSHHNQAAMQQHHHMATGKANSHSGLVVNASMHDHQHSQQQQQQQIGGGGGGPTAAGTTTIVGLGSGTAVPVVHGGGSGKKLGSSSLGSVPGGGSLANLKVYNSIQSSNLARLQQDRDYVAMGSTDSVGMHGAGVGGGGGGIPPGSGGIPVGSAIRTAGGSMITSGGAVMVEKDRNHHHMGSVGPGSGGGGGLGAGGLNAKYIHGTNLSALNPTAGLVGGNVLPPGGGPNVVSNVMANLVPASVGSGGGGGGGGGVNPIKRSPSYASQIGFVGSGGPSGGGHGNSMSTARDRGDGTGPPPIKRHKPICRDVSLAEASKYGTLNDYAFFDKVRKALRSPDVYEDFLRCLTLYNQEIVSKSELQTLITPFLSRFPDLLKWFQDFLGPSNGTGGGGGGPNECIPLTAAAASAARQDRDRTQSELATDVDLSTCKRFGASYCALPKSHEGVKCSGRTSLCRDVLNDTWVSFPTWAEDSTFVTSRKTQYEEFIYRCEDERFELDVVIESNSATIRVLEGVQKKLTRMSQDEVSRFRLDDCLGGTSATIHQRALRRIYGDKAADIIQGLKKNPSVAVPVVLRRMKAKEEEWREAQKSFNKQWREQNEKYYLKSLDHQGINFKQTDIKALRSKSLFNEIETLFDERHEQNDDSATVPQANGPHMTIPYKDKTILEDAANLLIHHVKRQTGIQKQEKARIKHILRQFVPDLFFAPRQQLSEDEREEDDKDTEMEQDEEVSSAGKSSTGVKKASCTATSFSGSNTSGSFNPSGSASAGGPAASSDASTTTTPTVESEGGVSKDRESNKGGDEATAAKATSIGSASAELLQLTPTVATSTGGLSTPTRHTGSEIAGDNNTSKADSNGNSNATEDSTTDKSTTIKMEIKEENDASVMQDTGATTTATGSAAAPTGTSSPQQQPLSPPLPPHAVSKHIEEAYTLFFTNNSWYLFLRLHAILCERLRTIYERAQIIAAEERAYESTRNNSTATALRLKTKSEIRIEDYYNTFLEMLKNLLDGNMESSSYEDTLREMFGIHAYIAFTLDRVVQNAVRQLQHCVTERGALECVELFQAEQRRGGAGGLCRTANRRIATELAYQRKAETALQDENCFKIYIYKIDCRVTIELLDTESDDTATNFANTQAYGSYVNRLSNPAATGTGSDSGGGGGGGGGSGGAVSGSGGVVGGSGVVGNSGGGGGSGVGDAGVSLNANNSNSVNSSNLNNTPTGTNTSSSSSSTTNAGGGSTTNAEVKTETPDEELKLRQPLSGAARMPVFLSRNVKQRRKNTDRTVSVTIDGKSVTMGELQGSDVEEDTVEVDTIMSSTEDKNASPVSNAINASVLQGTATTHNSKPPYHHACIEGDSSSRKENDAREASTAGKLLPPEHLENVGVSAASTTMAKGTEPKSPSSAKDNGGSTTSGGNNNNNLNNINNNNSIGNSGGINKHADNPSLWFASGSLKKPPPPSSSSVPSSERRLPNMNGADRALLYIDDSEQMKVARTTCKTSQVQKKNFTMYWHGSLTRSRKSHCRVTTRMDQRFKSVVDRWLDQHVTDMQRASCVDWLLGKRQDLVKSTTSVIVQDNGLSRTPYAPYNRYKVNQLEID